MIVRTQAELDGMAAAGQAVSKVMEAVCAAARPGVTTRSLDHIAREVMQSQGARSAPRTAYRFPGYSCLSVNRQAAHGIPGWYRLHSGDTLNVDISLELGGYFSDAGRMVLIGQVGQPYLRLCDCVHDGLMAAIMVAQPGASLRELGAAMEEKVRLAGFSPIKNLTGHGIGRALHEDPRHVFGYDHQTESRHLEVGMVVALECFAALFSNLAEPGDDGWAMLVQEMDRAAQEEHTVMVCQNGPLILTKKGEKPTWNMDS